MAYEYFLGDFRIKRKGYAVHAATKGKGKGKGWIRVRVRVRVRVG